MSEEFVWSDHTQQLLFGIGTNDIERFDQFDSIKTIQKTET